MSKKQAKCKCQNEALKGGRVLFIGLQQLLQQAHINNKGFLSLFWQQRYHFRFAVLTHLNGFSLPEETTSIPALVEAASS